MDNRGGGDGPPPSQVDSTSHPLHHQVPVLASAAPSSSFPSSSFPPSSSSSRSYHPESGSGGRGQPASRGRGSGPLRDEANKPFANKSMTFNHTSAASPEASLSASRELHEDDAASQHASSSSLSLPASCSSTFLPKTSLGSTSTSGYSTRANSQEPSSTVIHFDASDRPLPSSAAAIALPPEDDDVSSTTAWDSDGGDEGRRKRFARPMGSNRFLEMKTQRPLLRQRYIDQGILPDPDKPQQLSAASRFTGTCMDMCPEFEREEREFQGEGDQLEVYTGTTKLDPTLAVKIYRRPAAGRELPLPEDVRPPPILKRTLDYLFHTLIPSSPDSQQLSHVQGFIWNRTRAIRQDFIVQGQSGPLTIECHERIARWHILSLHWRGGGVDEAGQPRDWPSDLDPWSEQQELEQLAKTLTSLNEFYDDLRMSTGKSSLNEAEFRAYHLILNLYDPEVQRNVELLPEEVFDAPILQTAIRLRGYAQRSNRGGSSRANALNTDAPMNFFSRFFAEIKASNGKVPYLLGCMLENKFASVREGGLKALCSNYNKVHRGPSLAFVMAALGADTVQEVEHWADVNGIEVQREDNGEKFLKLHKQIELIKSLPPSFSLIVEAKRGNYSTRQIIDGVASNAATLLSDSGLNNSSAPKTRLSTLPASNGKVAGFGRPGASHIPISFTPLSERAAVAPSPIASSSGSGKAVSASIGSVVTGPAANAFGKPALATKTQMTATASPFQPSHLAKVKQEGGVAFPFENFSPSSHGDSKSVTALAHAPELADLSKGSSPLQVWAPVSLAPRQTKQRAPGSAVPHDQKFDLSADSLQSSRSTAMKPGIGTPHPSAPVETPSQLALPASNSSFPSAVKPTRRPADACNEAVERILSTLVANHMTSIAQKAFKKEEGRRRSEARQACLGSMTRQLGKALRKDVLTKVAADIAAEATADESRRRMVVRAHFDLWQVKLGIREERRRQKARLEDVRAQVIDRGLLDQSLSTSRGGLRAVLMLPEISASATDTKSVMISSRSSVLKRSSSSIEEDDELRSSYCKSKAARSHLWARGTFFTCIASHVASLILGWRPVEMGPWTVLLSLADESSASAWLKHKFDLTDEQPQKTIPIAMDVEIREELVDDPAEIGHHDTGLVIFVLSAALAARDQRDEDQAEVWALEAERLRVLEESEALSTSRFLPRLLLVDWNSGDRTTVVLSRLGLDAGSDSHWKDVGVCFLGGSQDTDSLFKSAVSNLLQDVSLRPRPTALRMAEFVAPLRRPWSIAAVTVEGMLARLPTKAAGATAAVFEVLVAMLGVANHLIETLALVSQHEQPPTALLLPQPSPPSLLERFGHMGFVRALEHVTQDIINSCDPVSDEESLSFSRYLAVPPEDGRSKPFPLAWFLENLLESKLNLIARSWYLPSGDEKPDMLLSLEEHRNYIQEAVDGIVSFAAGKVRDYQEAEAFEKKRRRRTDTEQTETVVALLASRGANRTSERKRGVRDSREGSTSPSSPSKRSRSINFSSPTGEGSDVSTGDAAVKSDFLATPDVQKLRGLMASARSLLAGQSA